MPATKQPPLSIDICCRRRRSAANPPAAVATVDRRDRQTGGQTGGRTQRRRTVTYRTGSVNRPSARSDDELVSSPVVELLPWSLVLTSRLELAADFISVSRAVWLTPARGQPSTLCTKQQTSPYRQQNVSYILPYSVLWMAR